MDAHALLKTSALGPDAINVLTAVYDDVWAEIAPDFEGDLVRIKRARMRLAQTILSIAYDGISDPDALKQWALLSRSTKDI